MYEVNETAEMISRAVDSEAEDHLGASIDPTMNGKVRVTVCRRLRLAGPRASVGSLSGPIEFRQSLAGQYGRYRGSRFSALSQLTSRSQRASRA